MFSGNELDGGVVGVGLNVLISQCSVDVVDLCGAAFPLHALSMQEN